jgi:hypothetical protein
MKDLIEKALIYQEYAATMSNAYYFMANYCRRNHMRLGVVATIVSTLVGTALFAGLVTQVGSDGNPSLPANLSYAGLLGYLVVALFSIGAPVLTGLQTFLKYAEQAEKHRASAISYDLLRPRLDLFILRFRDSPDADRDNGLKALEAIVGEMKQIADGSLTIPDHVYDVAALKRRTRAATPPNNPLHPTAATGGRG